VPQSTHFNILSWNSIEDAPSAHSRPTHARMSRQSPPRARVRRILTHPPQLNCPWIRPAMPVARTWITADVLKNPRGCAYPRPGRCTVKKGRGPRPRGQAAQFRSVLLFPSFFPAAFARQCFLHALFLAGLQIKGVALDLLDDVLLLHLALETAQCILKRLTLLQSHFCQRDYTPKPVQWDCIVIARFCTQVKGYVEKWSTARAGSDRDEHNRETQ
jgi:hypothetical protein